MRPLDSVLALLLLVGCSQKPAVPAADKTPAPAAEFGDDEWVAVSEGADKTKYYVDRASVFPYNDLVMAEVAEGTKKSDIYTYAFACKRRLVSRLGEDGSTSPLAPVRSWDVHSRIFNFVCFGSIPPYLKADPVLEAPPGAPSESNSSSSAP